MIAGELRLTPATIRTWIADGTLQAKRAGKRKWLVRRSELDRMLRGEDYEGAKPLSPREPGDPGPHRRLRRTPDLVTARSWTTGEQHLDPEDWLGVAEAEWRAAVASSRQAPPDSWFPSRLQHLARAASRKAGALEPLDPNEEVRWDDEPLDAEFGLSYELRPGAHRPGAPELWDEFDRRLATLAAATETGRARGISAALSELAVVLHDIAEELDRYRGSHGDWLPHPLKDDRPESVDRPDPDPPATDESVS